MTATGLREGIVRVRVTAVVSGEVIPGALVCVDGRVSGNPRLLFGTTNVDGSCAINFPADAGESRVAVAVRAKGRRERPLLEYPDCVPFSHAVRAGEVTEVEVAMMAGPAVMGTVTDEAGRGLPGVNIEPFLMGPQPGRWRRLAVPLPHPCWPPPVYTDERGRFEWWSFEARHDEEGPSSHLRFLADPPDY